MHLAIRYLAIDVILKPFFLHHLLFKLFRKHTQWKGRGKWKEAEKDSDNRSQRQKGRSTRGLEMKVGP